MNSADKAKAMVQAIAQEAQAIWGDDWIKYIVRKYCEIESLEADEIIKPIQRRSTIVRALDTGAITLETLIRLADCVGMSFIGEIQRKEIRRF
ncbi:MAG: hypothetical protein HC881_03645 [Leptolyngbyaceae cyanobacterium SL_7_1]|nr:hypothetical protein [Leptolyngbyaceae cyanobacterium SL_7_1]